MGVFGKANNDKSNGEAQENANSPSSASQGDNDENAVDPGNEIQPGVVPSDSTRDEQEGERDPGTGSVNDPAKQPITGATSSFQTSSVGSGSDNTNEYHTGSPAQAGEFNDDAGSGPTVGTPNAPSTDGPDDGEVRPEQEGGVEAEPATTTEPNPDYLDSGEADVDEQGGAPADPASDEEADEIDAANSGETTTTPKSGKSNDNAGANAARGGK